MSVSGHCLCGEIHYDVQAEFGPAVNCHCSYCRRAHGAAFVPVALVPRAAIRFTSGEQHLRIFETPGGGQRCFCDRCGTRICNYPKKFPAMASLVLESLDQSITTAPAAHINVESKAPWYQIRDDAPQFDSIPKAASSRPPEG